jgi:hypothetical protein
LSRPPHEPPRDHNERRKAGERAPAAAWLRVSISPRRIQLSNIANRAIGALVMLAALCAAPLAVSAMTIRPLVLDLQTTGRGTNQVILVENNSAVPLPVEVSVNELIIDSDRTSTAGEDPGDIVVFPPQALIEPGETQTFRVQYVGDQDLAAAKHYYITFSQIPLQGQAGVQIVYNFQALASVGPQDTESALRVQSAVVGTNDAGESVPVVTVANESLTYGYLSRGRLRIVQTDSSGREVFRETISGPEIQQALGMGLISSGQQRQFALPLVLPLEDGTIAARFTPDR